MKAAITLKKAGVILMVLSLINLFGCSALNKENAKEITTELNKKYGEDFACKSIGNRLGTADKDTVTAYCYPESDPELLFQVIMNTDGELESDTYVSSYVSQILEKELAEELKGQNVTAHINASAYGYGDSKDISSPKGLTIDGFIEKKPGAKFTAMIIVDSNSDNGQLPTAIYEAYSNLASKYPQLVFGSQVRIIGDKDYEKCAKEMGEYPTVSSTFFQDYDVQGKAIVGIEGGKPKNEISDIVFTKG